MNAGKNPPDLRPLYAAASPYRVRLPGSIAQVLEWPTASAQFDCYGVFRTSGEMLCAMKAATLPDGTHPLQSALDYRARMEVEATSVALSDLPPSSALMLDFLVFEFIAKWTNAKRDQLDLKLTTTRTSLLGWKRGGESPPIYPRVWPGVLILLSQQRVFAIQDEQGSMLTEG